MIYGKAGQTASEAQERWQKGEERKMHEQFSQWLRLNGVPFIVSRFGVRATIRAGWPDFSMWHAGRACLVEMKAPGGKLTAVQKEVLAELELDGTPFLVAESVTAAITFAREILWEKSPEERARP